MSSHSDTRVERSRLAISFGIEFEFLLAFHESELLSVLRQNDIAATIHKDLMKIERETLYIPFPHAGDRPAEYPSWGLMVEGDDITLKKRLVSCIQKLRRYFVEPLLIARNVLQRNNCHANVVGSAQPGSPVFHLDANLDPIRLRFPTMDYSRWNLTYDQSLMGATKEELLKTLPDKITTDNMRDWDSWGVELVSRKFEVAREAEASNEISKYLSVLKNDSDRPINLPASRMWGAFESDFASTHVHIGLDSDHFNLENEILVLQHVIYILISHETLIMQLHPPHRYNGRICTNPNPQSDTNSNADYVATRHLNKGATRRWDQIRDQIFAKHIKPSHLFDLVQPRQWHGTLFRGFLVNFSNLDAFIRSLADSQWEPQTPVKPTVEFRQHACCLNEVDVRHWLHFLLAIFRTAERLAAQTTQFDGNDLDPCLPFPAREGSKHVNNDTWQMATVEDLCGPDLLNLRPEEISFWQGRFEAFATDVDPPPWAALT